MGVAPVILLPYPSVTNMNPAVRGGAVRRDTALLAGRSRVRFPVFTPYSITYSMEQSPS
jgi:hypothetical protein